MPTDIARFYPSLGYYHRVPDIPFDDPIKIPPQYRVLVLDVDNTLVGPMDKEDVSEEMVKFLHELKQPHYPDPARIDLIALLSNMIIPYLIKRERRIEQVRRVIGADYLLRAYWPNVKPHPAPFERLLREMSVSPEQVIMVGDQLHTDIRGGNAAGMATIKVDPLGPDPIWIRQKRAAEKRLMRELGLVVCN